MPKYRVGDVKMQCDVEVTTFSPMSKVIQNCPWRDNSNFFFDFAKFFSVEVQIDMRILMKVLKEKTISARPQIKLLKV